MPERKCLTCKHYEAAPMRRKGWCRNPLLYAPHQSHLVNQDDLDCGRGLGNYWEPADHEERANVSTADGNNAKPERRPLRFFTAKPQFVPATAGADMVARSSTGGGAGSTGGTGGPPPASSGGGTGGRSPGAGAGGPGGAQPPYPNQPRPTRTAVPQGQERTVSYQPEERYWTDYLRIALPVVGLLLLLGLFWFWASSLIGNNSTSPPKATATAPLVIATAPLPTATVAPTVAINANPVTQPPTGQTPTAPKPTQSSGQPTQATSQPTQPAAASGGFSQGDTVIVTEDGVNLREQASTASNAVQQLAKGAQLVVTGLSQEAGGITWWPVADANDQTIAGFVAGQYIRKA